MRKLRVFAIGTTTLTLSLIGVTAAPASTTVQAGVESPTPAPTASCVYTTAVPADRFKGIPAPTAAQLAKPYTAILHTGQGPIIFQALTANAPCTTYSFRFLAERGYFGDTHCHRLTTQHIFVLQCGDPTGTGSGGPGYAFPDENLAGATYPAGTVAMANAGPNTNGSQFFFTWADTQLAPNYTPFGTVTAAGLAVLRKIAAAGDDSQNGPGDGFPTLPVVFRDVDINLGK